MIPNTGNSSRGSMSAANFNGKIHLLESGTVGSSTSFIDQRTSTNPGNVNSYSAPAQIVSSIKSDAPATTVFQNKLYTVYRNANNQMSYRVIADNIAPALTAPTNLAAVHQPLNNRVLLTWNDSNADETGFTVQRSENNAAYVTIGNPNNTGSNLNFPDPNITAGNTYKYRVRARRGNENSGFSNIATVSIAQTINAPSNLRATVLSSSRIRLNWNDNSNNETKFRIQRALGNGGFQTIKEVNANQTTHTDINLAVNTRYRYRVFAVNGTLVSTSSNIISARTFNAPPNAPSNFSATYNAALIAVDFAWNDNSNNETSFEIEFKLQSESQWVPLPVDIPANATSAFTSVTNVIGGNTYDVRVRAVNSVGPSPWSNIDPVFLPLNPLPVAPTNLTASYNAANNTINLAWQDNSVNELGFTIEFEIGNSGWSEIVGQPGANATGKQISNPPCCFIYNFRIRSRNAAGNSLWSNTASVLVTGSARAAGDVPNQVVTKSDVKVYPNPFRDEVTIAYPESIGTDLTVVITETISGRTVRTLSVKSIEGGGTPNKITWDGKGESGELLKPGTYLYQLRTSDSVVTGRVLLER